MRPELLEFGLEELVFLAGGGLLVENEDVADIVGVNLLLVSETL
jgi:hypothetical protein